MGSPPANFIHGVILRKNDALVFEERDKDGKPGSVSLALDRKAKRLVAYEDKPVVLGIRPEDLEDAMEEKAAPGATGFEATLEVLSPWARKPTSISIPACTGSLPVPSTPSRGATWGSGCF